MKYLNIFYITIAICVMGCEPRPEALIANRSGHAIIVYVDGKSDSFLLDGYD